MIVLKPIRDPALQDGKYVAYRAQGKSGSGEVHAIMSQDYLEAPNSYPSPSHFSYFCRAESRGL